MNLYNISVKVLNNSDQNISACIILVLKKKIIFMPFRVCKNKKLIGGTITLPGNFGYSSKGFYFAALQKFHSSNLDRK